MSQQTLHELKAQMCEIGRRIWQKGFCAGNEGNHSMRLPDQRTQHGQRGHAGRARYLCTPTGISKGFLEPDDICVIDEHANLLERNANGRTPSSEIKLHIAIYHTRPDVQAVIHSHPPHATAFAMAGIPLPEAIHPEAEVFLGRVKTAPYALPSTHALPDSITPLIEADTTTVLMGNHGSVTFSNTDLFDAHYKLEILDAYARVLILVRQLGQVNVLSQDQMVDLLKVKQSFGLEDSRLACAPQGCIGEANQPFLAGFDVRPSGATCACNGTAVESHHHQAAGPGHVPEEEPIQPDRNESNESNEDVFEQMVHTITDRIMAAKQDPRNGRR